MRVTENRYNLSASGKDKEEALEAFWQLVEIESLWEKTEETAERLAYFQGILAQEQAFQRKEVEEEATPVEV